MQLKHKYKISPHFHCSDSVSDKKADEFVDKLEELMNEYEVFQVDATLDPYDKSIKLI